MTDFVISCETFLRLASLVRNAPDTLSPEFRTVRIDGGIAIATDRSAMALEPVGGPSGIIHIIVDAALLAACEKEAAFSSMLTITVNEMLKFAVAKTTFGYIHPGNCGYFGSHADFDRWRSVVSQAKAPLTASKGAMFWEADLIARLGAASPSGKLVFEEFIDTSRPTLIRDVQDYNWLGIFQPFSSRESYSPATLPTWCVL